MSYFKEIFNNVLNEYTSSRTSKKPYSLSDIYNEYKFYAKKIK